MRCHAVFGRGAGGIQQAVDALAQFAHFVGQFGSAAGGFAQPERDGRGLAVGVLHPDAAAFDAADFPGVVAQQEYVAAHTFDGEILVDGADKGILRVGDDVVIGVFRDGAAAGHGGQRGAAPPLDRAVDAIAVQVGAAPAQPRRVSLG